LDRANLACDPSVLPPPHTDFDYSLGREVTVPESTESAQSAESTEFDLASYNPFDAAFQQDPYPAYAALRRQAPVFRHPRTGFYFVSSHAAVKRVLSDTETFSSHTANAQTSATMSPEARREFDEILSKSAPATDTLLTADPPRQTRYRKAMGRDFTQRVPSFEARIREIARELIDAWPQRRVDFMNTFAIPFPVRSIACALGMKSGMESDIKRWSDDSVAGLGVQIDEKRRLEAARGVLELQTYWTEFFNGRRADPRDDFVSDLARTRLETEDGSKRLLETPEAISILQQLMVAGNETTTKLLNEILKLLAQNPEQWSELRRDRSRIDSVIEEGLRMSSPNQGLFRLVPHACG
jgi:cytochrome P450